MVGVAQLPVPGVMIYVEVYAASPPSHCVGRREGSAHNRMVMRALAK